VVEDIPKPLRYGKPIVAMAAGGPYTQRQVRKLQERGIPAYPTPKRSVKAVKNLTKYHLEIRRSLNIQALVNVTSEGE